MRGIWTLASVRAIFQFDHHMEPESGMREWESDLPAGRPGASLKLAQQRRSAARATGRDQPRDATAPDGRSLRSAAEAMDGLLLGGVMSPQQFRNGTDDR
jgi:hypothetical protein